MKFWFIRRTTGFSLPGGSRQQAESVRQRRKTETEMWRRSLRTVRLCCTRTFHHPAVQQAMMETFRTYMLSRHATEGSSGRSSTQIVFHVRRIVSRALGIPRAKIRADEAQDWRRIRRQADGSCGGLSGLCHLNDKEARPNSSIPGRKPDRGISPAMRWTSGSARRGQGRDDPGLDLYNLSNSGAYGDHGPTTAGLTGHKSIPLYTGRPGGLSVQYLTWFIRISRLARALTGGMAPPRESLRWSPSSMNWRNSLGMDSSRIRHEKMVRERCLCRLIIDEMAKLRVWTSVWYGALQEAV